MWRGHLDTLKMCCWWNSLILFIYYLLLLLFSSIIFTFFFGNFFFLLYFEYSNKRVWLLYIYIFIWFCDIFVGFTIWLPSLRIWVFFPYPTKCNSHLEVTKGCIEVSKNLSHLWLTLYSSIRNILMFYVIFYHNCRAVKLHILYLKT